MGVVTWPKIQPMHESATQGDCMGKEETHPCGGSHSRAFTHSTREKRELCIEEGDCVSVQNWGKGNSL